MTARAKTALFLFNHDAPHQVAHLAGIVRETALGRPDVESCVAVGTPAIAARLRALLGPDATARATWLDIGLPGWMDAALAVPNMLAPVKRIARLDHHAARIGEAAVVVSAERTCLRLRRKWPAGHSTRFIHVPHGAGDRAVTYHADKSGFDLMLVSGPKAARELEARANVPAGRIRIVGYPKFDTVDLSAHSRFFNNDNPVFLYNPHFDPLLSSWYDEGPALMDWFASPAGQRFNLIFAPHIMLFRKALHISLEYRVARRRPAIAPEWEKAPNILIDTGSARLVDMSYTLAADAYIGDVSSQIYEFLVRPRSAFFIDRFTDDPRSREGRLAAWQAGDVVRHATDLPVLLADHDARGSYYRQAQDALFADTFSLDTARSASARAAAAIADFTNA